MVNASVHRPRNVEIYAVRRANTAFFVFFFFGCNWGGAPKRKGHNISHVNTRDAIR